MTTSTATNQSQIAKAPFGKAKSGAEVDIYTLTNTNGAIAKITNFGATLTELWMPDKKGITANVILGFDNVAQYEDHTNPHFGGTIGRYANRIGNAQFTIDGTTFNLAKNNGPNNLHGGPIGWDRQVWQAEAKKTTEGPSVKFTLQSKDGDSGFPGTVTATVTYTLTNDNALRLDYSATTDKTTPINLCNHAYFNLAGAGTRDVLNHELTLFADRHTPTDDTLIPTGELAPVKSTALDFTKQTKVGAHIAELKNGYDHNFVLCLQPRSISLAARLFEPSSGRTMEVWTTEPGLQLYTSYWLDGTLKGNGGTYNRADALCLETQHFPDSVNKPQFASPLIAPGEEYRQTTIYKFGNQD